MLALTCRHASHTISFGITNDFSSGLGILLRLLPGHFVLVERIAFLISRPLRSTPTPVSRSFTTNTGRSASEHRNRYSMPPVSAVSTLPLAARQYWPAGPDGRFRRSPSHVPCQSRRPGSRRLHAGHHLASHRDTRQAHHERTARPLAFDATSIFLLTTHQQRTPTPRTSGPGAFWNVFLVPT